MPELDGYAVLKRLRAQPTQELKEAYSRRRAPAARQRASAGHRRDATISLNTAVRERETGIKRLPAMTDQPPSGHAKKTRRPTQSSSLLTFGYLGC